MIVIAPHPTEELRLINYQKELVRRLFTPGALIYAHQPLWFPVDFASVQEAKECITGVTLTGVEYDVDAGVINVLVKIDPRVKPEDDIGEYKPEDDIGGEALRHRERHCKAGQKQSGGLFLASLRAAMLRRAKEPQFILPFIHLEGDIPNVQAALKDTPLFPMPLKILRLGECTSPSPGVYELSNTVWKKLT